MSTASTRIRSFALLPLLVALALSGCGGASGFPNEPAGGVGGLAWSSPAGEDLKSSEGLPSAIPASVISFEPLGGPAKGLKSFFRPERDELWGLPPARPQYLFHDDGLCAVVFSLDGPGRQPLVGKFGEPHAEKKDGPYTSLFWYGKVADVELRGGGPVASGDVVLVTHRATFQKLAAQ